MSSLSSHLTESLTVDSKILMSGKQRKRFVPHSHIPYGPDGSGYYSDHNTKCYQINNAAIPLLVDAVQSTDIQTGSVFTIVDYGTADGGTSMPLMYACVKAIREKYGDKLPINIIYEDQPVNDFKSLFMRLQGLIPGPPSYLADFNNVYVMACGTNYYEQCFSSNSVNLGFSGTSMHWLSRKPCDLTDSIFVHLNTVQEENDKFREQAAKDWEQLLLNRAAELVPGGRMFFAMVSVDQQWSYDDTQSKLLRYQVLTNLWKNLVDEVTITAEEFKNTNFVSYFRTIEEYKKPFECKTSPVVQAGLELVTIETRLIPCQHREKWLKKESDLKEYGRAYAASVRTPLNSTLMSGLSDDRSTQEKQHVVDELFRRFENEVIKRPDDFSSNYFFIYLTVEKRAEK